MSEQFAENPAYVEYERLTLELHELFARGAGESDRAEEVRDQMDGPWKRLDASEVEHLNGLASDLAATFEGVARADRPDPAADPALLDHARAVAYSRREWRRFLALMRDGATTLDAAFVAFARARAYQELGHAEAGLAFMRRAAELNPKDNYKGLLLALLQELNRFDEAVPLAERCVADPESGLKLLTVAAGVLFASTRSAPEDSARHRYRVAVEALTRALGEDLRAGAYDRDERVVGHVLRGLCLESLGQFDAAENAYDDALDLEPNSQIARLAKSSVSEQRQQSSGGAGPSQSAVASRERRHRIAEQAGMYLHAA